MCAVNYVGARMIRRVNSCEEGGTIAAPELENGYADSLENMASVTQQIYFQDVPLPSVNPDPSSDTG